ncbi:hypothetical protein SBF1_190091 [Candidatus Desulfosporosinus infrequens]|uniref:Uncharacterized protein n=1 Tax=Candidatus Desulfosporosinus infrequens TaxID=2043169 RepID=A0A2U3KF21_9FIRM|nr:hypothetical protein SBF1_190091 [Candidatus Desulfosporosinus infrequens]
MGPRNLSSLDEGFCFLCLFKGFMDNIRERKGWAKDVSTDSQGYPSYL